MNPKFNQWFKGAFALLEILIVIAIVALLAGITLPQAHADPQTYVNLPVTNITALASGTAQTAVGATFNVLQNSQMILQNNVQCFGTNNAAGTIVYGYNFTVGNGVWTTTLPVQCTNTLSTSNLVSANIIGWTNTSGFSQGRLDYVLISGATNATVNSAAVGWKTVYPY